MSEHQSENPQFDAEDDPAPAGLGEENLEKEPGLGGYAGRDPKSEMPRVPSVPEKTQDDAATQHSGAPKHKDGDGVDPHG